MAKSRSEINYAYSKKAYDDIRLQVPKGQKEVIRAHAASTGESIQAFVRRAITETMERDNKEKAK